MLIYQKSVARLATLIPGLLACAVVSMAAGLLASGEVALFGRAWIETLVLAIILGVALRSRFMLPSRFDAGIGFSAHFLLEAAVALLGVSVSASDVFADGVPLLSGIVVVVLLAIAISFGIGCLFGLPRKMALLIACGNAICGNSAIAAVAPLIDASSEDVASAIAFTAVLGIAVVLGLPLIGNVLALSQLQFGVLAGLTVYAVPQVLAATASAGLSSTHMGTVVKLVRVLMLGPVILALSLAGRKPSGRLPPMRHLLPWFIVGFLSMMGLRSAGVIPNSAIALAHHLADAFTCMSMAGLGLGVDVRAVLRAGRTVTLVVVLSLLCLGAISLLLIFLLGKM